MDGSHVQVTILVAQHFRVEAAELERNIAANGPAAVAAALISTAVEQRIKIGQRRRRRECGRDLRQQVDTGPLHIEQVSASELPDQGTQVVAWVDDVSVREDDVLARALGE